MTPAPCQSRNAPDAACRPVGVVGFCERCGGTTPTIYLPLSSGDIGNVCAVCHTCRKVRPFVTRREYETSLTPDAPAEGECHETQAV